MTEIKIKYADVLAAARELAAAKDDERGWWRGYELPSVMAHKLGVSDQWARPRTTAEYAAVQRFQGQCLRTFNQLATEGVLIKYSRGQRDAHGHYLSNETAFYTPAADKIARDEHARQQAEAAAEQARWERIYDQLTEAGLEPLPVPNVMRSRTRGLPVTLSPADFERLLGGDPE